MRYAQRLLIVALLTACAGCSSAPFAAADQLPDRTAGWMNRLEHRWQHIEHDPVKERFSVRDLFTDALAICRTGRDRSHLQRLFELAERCQERDPHNGAFGNFYWYSDQTKVGDYNAVEFCMQGATIITQRYHDDLPPAAREIFDRVVRRAVTGCIHHHVPATYTNIALMNATNLILLGQWLHDDDAATIGRRRLDAMLDETWQHGTHEYTSPTYTAVDLTDAARLEQGCTDPVVVAKAKALRRLWWTDIAANWFDPAQRLGGPCSRTYAYQRNDGSMDVLVDASGWFGLPMDESQWNVFASALDVTAPASREQLAGGPLPRLVRASWGTLPREDRTHWITPHITLGSAGATYGSQDEALTVDFMGGRDRTRAYFMPDGRDNPYGVDRYTQRDGHQKALHLTPFWAATQRRGDALGVVLYHKRDLDEAPKPIVSQFVMPADATLYVGGQRVDKFDRITLEPGEPIVLHDGPAAMGFRVISAWGFDGKPAKITLINDSKAAHGALPAIRVAIEHGDKWTGHAAGAALWVRVGDGVTRKADFAKWREQFEQTAASQHVADGDAAFGFAGTDGNVEITLDHIDADHPNVSMEPTPYRGVLEVNGKEVGRPILESLPSIAALAHELKAAPVIPLDAHSPTTLNVSQAIVLPPMWREDDDVVAGRGDASLNGAGQITWRVKCDAPMRVTLAGELTSPNPQSDSFFVQVVRDAPDGGVIHPTTAWHTGVHPKWTWTPMQLGDDHKPSVIELPAGVSRIELNGRESGIRIRQMRLTPVAAAAANHRQ